MQSGNNYKDGEENGSLGQNCVDQGVPVETAEPTGGSSSIMASGCGEDKEVDERRKVEGNGREPSGGEHGQEDVEMNGSHDSVRRGTLRHSSSADGSPGSTTGSSSTKR